LNRKKEPYPYFNVSSNIINTLLRFICILAPWRRLFISENPLGDEITFFPHSCIEKPFIGKARLRVAKAEARYSVGKINKFLTGMSLAAFPFAGGIQNGW
jgi:hypothetical protein